MTRTESRRPEPATARSGHAAVATRRAAPLARGSRRPVRRPWAYLWALLPAAITLYGVTQIAPVARGETRQWLFAWVPSLGVELAFRLDGLSLLFALLISGIGTLVLLYSASYLSAHPRRGRFLLYLLLFMGAMLGLVLADDLLLLFVFWEATSVTSYLLVGFKHESAKARRAALQALLVTGGGGLALLAGLLLLAQVGGTLALSELVAGGSLATSTAYAPILGLVAVGSFAKSAQFPFHFWLPGAMAAPTPASAYLHSATMVKAGIYLMARLFPVLGGTLLWSTLLGGVGALTMLLGAWLAWRQQDLKLILAYSTVAALGTLTMLLGLGTATAIKGAIIFLLGHALYKAALFLVAGAVDHAAGSRRIDELAGLRRAMPVTTLAATGAALSMAGLPPLVGFVGKEVLYEATLAAPAALVLTTLAVVANALTLVAAGLVGLRPFVGVPRAPRPAREVPAAMWLGPLLLAALGPVLGLLVGPVGDALVAPAAAAVAGSEVPVKLALWHGINPMLLLSLVTVAVGMALYVGRNPLLRRTTGWGSGRFGPARAYQLALDGLPAVGEALTSRVQSGYLRRYLLVILGTLLLMVGGGLIANGGSAWPVERVGARPAEAAAVLMIIAASGVAATTRSRLAAVVAVGVVGYSAALLYVLFGAPDLAMTQLAIESLTVILLVLVLYRLPRFTSFTNRATRARDGVVALLAGGTMSALILAILALPHPQRLTPFFAEASLPLARGRNVVNVILVDFRALDTLGEIVVLAVAALGVVSLLRLRPQPSVTPTATGARTRNSLILRTATRSLFPLLALFAIFLLLRGHNAPGGGFVGGLVIAAAIALYALAYGHSAARQLLHLPPSALIIGGLALALASGLVGPLTGRSFLTGVWAAIELPVLGKLGTPLLFDVGVLLVVVGITVTILFELMEE